MWWWCCTCISVVMRHTHTHSIPWWLMCTCLSLCQLYTTWVEISFWDSTFWWFPVTITVPWWLHVELPLQWWKRIDHSFDTLHWWRIIRNTPTRKATTIIQNILNNQKKQQNIIRETQYSIYVKWDHHSKQNTMNMYVHYDTTKIHPPTHITY
jgi:hypothetical protein